MWGTEYLLVCVGRAWGETWGGPEQVRGGGVHAGRGQPSLGVRVQAREKHVHTARCGQDTCILVTHGEKDQIWLTHWANESIFPLLEKKTGENSVVLDWNWTAM